MSDGIDTEIDRLLARIRNLEWVIKRTRQTLAVAIQIMPKRFDGVKERLSVLRDDLDDALRGDVQ